MTNKIGPVDPNMIGKIGGKLDEANVTPKVSPDRTAQDSAANPSPSASDTVQLTSGAQLLERLEKSLDALPAVDSRRVEEIKLAIESGNYDIDAEAIADAMIRFERSLGE